MNLMSSLIPIIVGHLSSRPPIIGSWSHLIHNSLNYPYDSIETYKYKLMSIVEGENYRGIVMMLD